jgi:CRP-like cAMP-binding protein
MDNGKHVIYEAGQVIFREGEPADCMYILLDGEVELTKRGENGNTLLRTINESNDFFGEMALIDEKPRSATATSNVFSMLVSIDGPTFENLLLTNGKFAVKIIKVLSERIRATNVQIQDLADTDRRERVLRGIADYAFKYGDPAGGDSCYVLLEKMKQWINEHTGCGKDIIEATCFRLKKSEDLLFMSPRSKKEGWCVVSNEFLQSMDRRRSSK